MGLQEFAVVLESWHHIGNVNLDQSRARCDDAVART